MKGAIFNFAQRTLAINNQLNCPVVRFRFIKISYDELEGRSEIATEIHYLQLEAEFHREALGTSLPCGTGALK